MSYVLAPNWADGWQLAPASDGLLYQEPAALRVLGTGSQAMVLWSSQRTRQDVTVSFTYERLDGTSDGAAAALPGVQGVFCRLYGNVIGDGTAGYPPDVLSWATIPTGDAALRDHAFGWRIAFDQQWSSTQLATDPNANGSLRLRVANADGNDDLVQPTVAGGPWQAQLGNVYRVRISRLGGLVSLQISQEGGSLLAQCSWSSPLLEALNGLGRLGLYVQPLRQVRLGDFQVLAGAVADAGISPPLDGGRLPVRAALVSRSTPAGQQILAQARWDQQLVLDDTDTPWSLGTA